MFRSVLPPGAQHFANDENDFREKIARLDISDLEYLVGCIRNGSESLGCIRPAYARVFVEVIAERLGFDPAEEVIEVYVEAGECDEVPSP
jgi:hypothetical protein